MLIRPVSALLQAPRDLHHLLIGGVVDTSWQRESSVEAVRPGGGGFACGLRAFQ